MGIRKEEGMTVISRNEVLRKLLHVVALIIPFGILYLPGHTAAALLIPVTGAAVAAEVLRQKWAAFGRLFSYLFGALMRPIEDRQLTGSTYYLLAGVICLLVFDKKVAYTAMAFIIVGDAAAALIGMRFGRIRMASGKSLEGMLACISACLLFWCIFPFPGFKMALAAAMITGILEMIPLRINDNLGVPVICGLILQTWAGW